MVTENGLRELVRIKSLQTSGQEPFSLVWTQKNKSPSSASTLSKPASRGTGPAQPSTAFTSPASAAKLFSPATSSKFFMRLFAIRSKFSLITKHRLRAADRIKMWEGTCLSADGTAQENLRHPEGR